MPALAASALLFAAGCSSAPSQADSPAAATADRQTEASASPTDRDLAVAAAPAGTATAAAHPGTADGKAQRTKLSVASYDSKTRRAVIASNNSGGTGDSGSGSGSTSSPPSPSTAPPSPSAPDSSPSPSASATTHRTAVGDVIASAPAPGAPQGLLAKVTKVIGETDEGTEVQTEPAQLNALFGDDTAKGSVPVDPAAFDVDKLLPDVDVSWSRTGDVHVGPEGATVPLGSLRLDVRAALPTLTQGSASAEASVEGFVQVAPQVDFRYGGEGADTAPASAYLGVSGDWTSGWSLKGRAGASATPVRIPFATLHADPVLQAGPVPVVVNLDLTCYVEISGDGRITVDVEQSLKGDFKAGGTFGLAQGWTPVSSSDMTSTPVRTSVTTAGSVKAALGAQATVGLYGSVGVIADLAPYVRGEGTGTITGTDDTFETDGSWAVYGGVDLSGTLRLQLTIFGTPVFQKDIPLGALHREWKLAGGETS